MKKLLPIVKRPALSERSESKGFTLIELLVVIAIIAILATIAATIFSGVQQRARDGRRQADIQAISKAYEANKTTGATTYPLILTSWFAGGAIPVDTWPTAVYSIIRSVTAGCTSINKPIAWLSSSANPTTNGSVGTCGVLISEAVSAAPVGITAFQICGLLEAGANPANIFCVPNQQ